MRNHFIVMKLTELLLVFLLAIVLTVSKVSDSLQDTRLEVVEAKNDATGNSIKNSVDSFTLDEMNVAYNKETKEIVFLNTRNLSGASYQK